MFDNFEARGAAARASHCPVSIRATTAIERLDPGAGEMPARPRTVGFSQLAAFTLIGLAFGSRGVLQVPLFGHAPKLVGRLDDAAWRRTSGVSIMTRQGVNPAGTSRPSIPQRLSDFARVRGALQPLLATAGY